MSYFKKNELMTPEQLFRCLSSPISTLGCLPLAQPISVGDIKATQKELSLARRELKKYKQQDAFQGNLIDFLCWISIQRIAKGILSFADNQVEKIPGIIQFLLKVGRENMTNALRLFHKNPHYLLDALNIIDQKKRRDLAQQIYCIWFDITSTELQKQSLFVGSSLPVRLRHGARQT